MLSNEAATLTADAKDDRGTVIPLRWQWAYRAYTSDNNASYGWTGKRVAEVSPMAYLEYAVTPETAGKRRMSCTDQDLARIFPLRPDMLATPLSGFGRFDIETIKYQVIQDADAPDAAALLYEHDGPQGETTVLFALRSEPLDWVGAVTFRCTASYGLYAQVRARHLLTVVNPKYRGNRLGPVISGMCGRLLGDALMNGFLADPQILKARCLELTVSAAPVVGYPVYLVSSFGKGLWLTLVTAAEWPAYAAPDARDEREDAESRRAWENRYDDDLEWDDEGDEQVYVLYEREWSER